MRQFNPNNATTLKVDQAKGTLDTMIRLYEAKHPQEMKEFYSGLEWKRQMQDNQFASSKKSIKQISNMRFGCSLPPGLFKLVEKAFPELFTDKEQFRWFMTNFPQFRVAEKL